MRKIVILGLLVITIFSASVFTADETAAASETNGAKVEFVAGDSVTFLIVSTPNGRRIVREVGKK